MTGQFIVLLTLAFPLTLGLLSRVGAPQIFFSLMAGELLGRYFGHDIEQQVSMAALAGWGEALLIVTPVLMTGLLLRSSVSRSRMILHIIPLALTGVIFAAFLLPVLPDALQQHVQTFALGAALLEANKAIIGIMIILQLITLWLLHGGEGSKKKSKKDED